MSEHFICLLAVSQANMDFLLDPTDFKATEDREVSKHPWIRWNEGIKWDGLTIHRGHAHYIFLGCMKGRPRQ